MPQFLRIPPCKRVAYKEGYKTPMISKYFFFPSEPKKKTTKKCAKEMGKIYKFSTINHDTTLTLLLRADSNLQMWQTFYGHTAKL